MADDNNSDDEATLSDHNYGDLMNLARSIREQFESVDIDTNAPKKNELIDALQEFDPEGSRHDGWTVEVDGSREDVDLLAVQTPDKSGSSSSGPTDATILYCLTRAETTDERIEALRSALANQTDFELREAGSGDKYAIVLPAEAQDGYEEAQQEAESDDDEDEAEESAESDEDAAESDSEEEAEGDSGSDEESDSEDSDASDEETDEEEEEAEADDDESDDEDVIDYDVAQASLEEKTQDELYKIAVDRDIDGRSSMDKGELVDAIMQDRVESGDVAEPPAA